MQDIWNVHTEFQKREKKCLNNQRREEGEGGEPELLILHPSPGSNRLKPSWQRHLVLWIPHKRADYGRRARGRAGLGQWNIFMTWYLIHKKNLKHDLIWIKVHFHVSLLLLFTLFHGVTSATFCLHVRFSDTRHTNTCALLVYEWKIGLVRSHLSMFLLIR